MPEFKNKEEYEEWKAQRIKELTEKQLHEINTRENKKEKGINAQIEKQTEESVKESLGNADIDYSLKIKLSKSISAKKPLKNIAPILVVIAIPILVVIIFISLYGLNYLLLQSKMNEVIKNDPRNQGVKVSVHYANYINPSVLIYDLKSISGNSKLDVFRVFLQFAERISGKQFDTVELCYRGKIKFKLNGTYFKKLGQEYLWQNPVYTIRTFSENLMTPDGLKAYAEWTGGIIGVSLEQMKDFNDFHDKWYVEDVEDMQKR